MPPRQRVAANQRQRRTQPNKAGLHFSYGRINRMLLEGNYAPRVDIKAAVYLPAVLEYLTAELLELSGNAARDKKKTRINPGHIMMAIEQDDELKRVFPQAGLKNTGVIPKELQFLLKKKKKKK